METISSASGETAAGPLNLPYLGMETPLLTPPHKGAGVPQSSLFRNGNRLWLWTAENRPDSIFLI